MHSQKWVSASASLALVAAGLVQGLTVAEDRAGFVMEVPAGETAIYAPVRDAAEAALKAMPIRISGAAFLLSRRPPPRE